MHLPVVGKCGATAIVGSGPAIACTSQRSHQSTRQKKIPGVTRRGFLSRNARSGTGVPNERRFYARWGGGRGVTSKPSTFRCRFSGSFTQGFQNHAPTVFILIHPSWVCFPRFLTGSFFPRNRQRLSAPWLVKEGGARAPPSRIKAGARTQSRTRSQEGAERRAAGVAP